MAGKGCNLPIFGLSKTVGVGRGIKIFLNLQGGATRGAVPNPWHRRNPSKTSNEKDRQIYRLRKKVKEKNENLFQLRNELKATNELAEDVHDAPSALQTTGERVGALPDFVVIGAMRGGTSRFYGLLIKHPHVKGAASKELHYFDRPGRLDKGVEWYRRCFPPPEWKGGQRTISGEATPQYLFDPLVPERMAQVVPEARQIVLLRNPVDRAYSHYHLSVRRGHETRSFEKAVEVERARLDDGGEEPPGLARSADVGRRRSSALLAKGIYVDQLLHWRRFFGEEQMLVLQSEEFYKHTAETLKLTQDFLGLPYREIKLSPRHTSRKATYEYEPMDPALRQRLKDFFEPHNRRLYDYLGRDFGW
jgi:hypothetical protein